MKASRKITISTLISLIANQACALGFEALDTVGYPISAGTHQPAGGITPYKICNPTGNYGETIAIRPTTTLHNTCAIVPAPTSVTASPEVGFTPILFSSKTRPIVMNNSITGGSDVNIGSLHEVVFRNASLNECIYATTITLSNVYYAGSRRFILNGIARGGFSNSGVISAAYSTISTYSDAVYRIGRTYTSVQHRAASTGSALPASGYYNLPLTPGSITSINGVNSGTPASSQQDAQLDANWVEFTTHAYATDGLSVKPISPTMYVKSSCATSTLTEADNAIRLRQTWDSRGSEFIEVRLRGYVPQEGNANPLPTPGSNY